MVFCSTIQHSFQEYIFLFNLQSWERYLMRWTEAIPEVFLNF